MKNRLKYPDFDNLVGVRLINYGIDAIFVPKFYRDENLPYPKFLKLVNHVKKDFPKTFFKEEIVYDI